MSKRIGVFVGAGLLVALALAFFVSPYASSEPDGLNKVAADKGVDAAVRDHPIDDGPLAGYGVEGVHDAKLSKGLAGIIGVTLTFATGYGVLTLVRVSRRRSMR